MPRSAVATNLDLVTEATGEDPPRVRCSLESRCSVGMVLVDKARPVADLAAATAWATTTGIPAALTVKPGGCLWHETVTDTCYTGAE